MAKPKRHHRVPQAARITSVLVLTLLLLSCFLPVMVNPGAVYADDSFVKLATPAPGDLPTGLGFGVAFSHDSTYMAVAHAASPYVTIYERSGDTFTKLATPVPADLPTGNGLGVAFSHDSTYMAVADWNSPYVTIYKRSDDTFTKLANPADPPAGLGFGVAFSHDSTYMAVACNSSPRVTIYERSGDTFTKLANPADPPTGSGRGVAFSHDSTYMAVVHSTSPYVTIYKIVPAPPTFASAATNAAGTLITITFSKNMANPADKHDDFLFKIDGAPRSFSAAALDADNTKINLTVNGAAIGGGTTVLVSYAKGTVLAADNGVLESFTDQPVTNNVPPPPTVTTNDTTSITTGGATLNGNLTNKGSAATVNVSFEYGTSSGVYPNATAAQAKTATGAFSAALTGLNPSTTYYCRAKADGDGTAYGVEKSFTTTTLAAPAVQRRASPGGGTAGGTQGQTQPQFTLVYMNVHPQQQYAGQPVTITTNVSNTGGSTGEYTVSLMINGQVEETRLVSVGALSALPVKFIVTRYVPGDLRRDYQRPAGQLYRPWQHWQRCWLTCKRWPDCHCNHGRTDSRHRGGANVSPPPTCEIVDSQQSTVKSLDLKVCPYSRP